MKKSATQKQSGIWSPSGIPLVQTSHEEEELLVIRNVGIRGHMSHQAKEHFDYRLDFDEVYRGDKGYESQAGVF